jgi:hypothetical protein
MLRLGIFPPRSLRFAAGSSVASALRRTPSVTRMVKAGHMFGQHLIFEGKDEISLTITITTMGVKTNGADGYPMKVPRHFLYFLPPP